MGRADFTSLRYVQNDSMRDFFNSLQRLDPFQPFEPLTVQAAQAVQAVGT